METVRDLIGVSDGAYDFGFERGRDWAQRDATSQEDIQPAQDKEARGFSDTRWSEQHDQFTSVPIKIGIAKRNDLDSAVHLCKSVRARCSVFATYFVSSESPFEINRSEIITRPGQADPYVV